MILMLLARLLEITENQSSKMAFADPQRQLNYGELTTFARVMRDIVCKESKSLRIGIMLPMSSVFGATLFGCFWAGRQAVPLNFLLQPAELQKIVRDADLDLIITIKHFAKLADNLGVKTLYLEKSALKRKFLFSKFKSTPPIPNVTEDHTAVILYTSGTSGEPKGVELTFGNLWSNCRDCAAHARINSDHVLLSILPPFHVFGLTAMTLLPVWMGMSVHCLPRFNPMAAAKTIEEKRISIIMAIPSMYAAILRVKRASPETFKSLFLAISGGEPLQASTASAFQEKFNIQLNEGYGLTETSPVVSINLPWDGSPGTVGKLIPNCEVQIVDSQDRPMPPGEDGEILVRGPGVMKGYRNQPDATAAVINDEGWFKTGDQGRQSGDGYLSITGRIKDMMIISGENVFPSEIENVLTQHPAVEEAAVIGVADPSRGEVPIAFVILKEDQQVGPNELRSYCRERLASLKVPREVNTRENLTRGPTGKILKRALREELELKNRP